MNKTFNKNFRKSVNKSSPEAVNKPVNKSSPEAVNKLVKSSPEAVNKLVNAENKNNTKNSQTTNMQTTFVLNKYSALGTYWFIYHKDKLSPQKNKHLKFETKKIINTFEETYSRFKPNSLVSILNTQKILVTDNKEFHHILQLSLNYNKNTRNFFNIAVGGELEKLGYKKPLDYTQKGSRKLVVPLAKILKIKGNKIILDKNYNIDLGGIGKSYLVNKLKEFYDKNGVKNYFINGGGDIYTNFEQKILIQNPLNTKKYLKEITVSKKGIATSSPIARSWKIKDKVTHHLINPKHLETNLNYKSCTVISDNVIDSDIWAKVILLSDADIDINVKNIEVYLIDNDLNIITLN